MDPATFETAEQKALTDELIRRAEALVPGIRQRSREAEMLRRLPDATMKEVEEAGLIEALSPRSFGGHGLGLRALCEVARTLAHGDTSTAWVVSFLMEHNWMACYFDMSAQRRIFADKPYLLAAAPLQPGGTAERVPGGFLVTGVFRYASAVMNSDWTFASTSVTEADGSKDQYTFLIPLRDVTVHDEWFFSGMAATGSTNVEAKDVFVPDDLAMPTSRLHSMKGIVGTEHPEGIYRYPILPALYAMMAAMALGCGEAAVELYRQKLQTSAPWGLTRIDRESARVRWLKAHQNVRLARMLYLEMMRTVIRKGEGQEDWALEETAQVEFDRVTAAHLCKDAIRLIADGAGSSAFHLDDPIQRYLRDIDVLANHIGMDWDLAADRDSRWLLGLGRNATDPHAAIRTPATASTAAAQNIEAVS
ncbi:MAG: acyl-CoA dehydrogenase family protein [Novosphingobium sp.]|nr:acyl-CoA dehydrogenase family protein [Novosphingobium sp.]